MDRVRRFAALFDMDGVVLDTEGQYDNFWREQGKRYHPDMPEFHKVIKGQTTELILKNYFEGDVALQQQVSRELDEFERWMNFPYFPGVEQLDVYKRQRQRSMISGCPFTRRLTRYPIK